LSYHIWGGGGLSLWLQGACRAMLASSDCPRRYASTVVAWSMEVNGHDEDECGGGSC